jgi:hypothetical protein
MLMVGQALREEAALATGAVLDTGPQIAKLQTGGDAVIGGNLGAQSYNRKRR